MYIKTNTLTLTSRFSTLDVLNLEVRTQKNDESQHYHIGHIIVALFAQQFSQMLGQKHRVCTD